MVTCLEKEEANIHPAAAAAVVEEEEKEEQGKMEPSPERRACKLVDISGTAHNPTASVRRLRPSCVLPSQAVLWGGNKIKTMTLVTKHNKTLH